jgi:hypothetical protein
VLYHQNFASLEGWTPHRAGLRLARGLDTPSCGTLPNSRVGLPLARDSASLEAHVGPPPPARDAVPALPTRALNALEHRGFPGQERILATPGGPLTPPGNPAPALFRQPPTLCGHLCHYTTLCGEASVN